MRRHAESLTILSGITPGRSWAGPVPVIDVMRAAAAEVEDYTRVTVVSDSDEGVAASAVTDMIHLLAELIENATLFSPSSTRVEVRAERVANGFAIEVEDRGLGIPAEQLLALNAQLASPPDFDLADADRLGLFVAGRLAARHGVHASLGSSPYRGIKAVVVLPDAIVVPAARRDAAASGATGPAANRTARLDLRAPDVLSLAGGGLATASPPTDLAPQADAHGTATATTTRGLPRRVRPGREPQADPAGSPAEATAPRQAPVDSPAPEDARSLAASLQTSWQRSRQEHEAPDSQFMAPGEPPARHDATAPHSTPSED
jgi:anti-sigma regulatory factor (Ser/Thr protein kinase)